MSKQDTKRYQDYADRIPYAPHINLFAKGGDLNPFSGGLSGNLGQTISIFGQALSKGLGDIGQMKEQKWQEKQADEIATFKRIEQGNQAFNQFQNQLQENKNRAIQEQQILAQQTIAQRNQRQAAALAELNGGTPEPNKYELGGLAKAGIIGGLIQTGLAIDQGLGSAIGGNYHSGVGDVMSKIPGLGIVGGITNALFGTKVNKAKLEAVENTKSDLTNAAMAAGTATSFDSVALNAPKAVNYDIAKAYSGGMFSKGKARRKNAELKRQLQRAEDFANRSVSNGINNVAENQDSSLASTYYAYGGILQPYSPEFNLRALGGYTSTFGNGAIGYAFTNDYLHNGYLNANRENKLDALNTNDVYLSNGNTMFAEGGNMNTPIEDYQEGNTYDIDEEEYRKLLEEGYQVEVINN